MEKRICIIQDEDGWGVSFDGNNPIKENYIRCFDKDNAFKLLSILESFLEKVEIIRNALEAPTHEANDYNCEDWPPGSECSGCNGDIKRKEALSIICTI